MKRKCSWRERRVRGGSDFEDPDPLDSTIQSMGRVFKRMFRIFSGDDVIVSRDIIGGSYYGESSHFSRALRGGSRDEIHLLGNSCNQLS